MTRGTARGDIERRGAPGGTWRYGGAVGTRPLRAVASAANGASGSAGTADDAGVVRRRDRLYESTVTHSAARTRPFGPSAGPPRGRGAPGWAGGVAQRRSEAGRGATAASRRRWSRAIGTAGRAAGCHAAERDQRPRGEVLWLLAAARQTEIATGRLSVRTERHIRHLQKSKSRRAAGRQQRSRCRAG